MRNFIILAVIGLQTAPAGAVVLTFDGEPFSQIGLGVFPEYGDGPHVEADSGTRAGFGDAATAPEPVVYYDSFEGRGYGAGAPSGVAIAGQDALVGEFSFVPDPGYEVTLGSFDVASYPNGTEALASRFAVYGRDWAELWASEELVAGAPRTLTPEVTADGPVYLQWGTDWNVGIDNIDVSVSKATPGVAPVPLPATAPALGGGLAFALTLVRARRRTG